MAVHLLKYCSFSNQQLHYKYDHSIYCQLNIKLISCLNWKKKFVSKSDSIMISASIHLTHWVRVTHICVGKLTIIVTIIGTDNGLSPEGRQAIICTNAGILLIGPLGTNFSEILIQIQTFSLKKICLKMSSAKCCSFHLGLNVLKVFKGKKITKIFPSTVPNLQTCFKTNSPNRPVSQ